MDVSVIIVNYNTKELTKSCINSIFEETSGVAFEVILVDNASTDGSAGIFEKDDRIKFVKSGENLGFGRANNVGAKHSVGKYLFFLNSDTVLVENIVKVFYDYMEEHEEYAACGCNLVDSEGREVVCHGNLPSLFAEILCNPIGRVFSSYYKNTLSIGQTISYGNITDTGYISGADIFIRAAIFEQFKGFDPNIFMYFEETDLFARMKKKGLKFCVIPDHKIIHLVGGSFNRDKKKQLVRDKMFEESHIYYYRKNHCGTYTKCAKIAVILSVLLSRRANKKEIIKIVIDA